MTPAYIALGSNLGEPREQLKSALLAIQSLPDCELLKCSPVYRSVAVGPGDQPDYLNAAAHVQTGLDPLDLLHALQGIESAQGRTREQRWGARTLDLDILLYGDLVMAHEELIIPHPRLQERYFVLYPLSDLEPGLSLPCGTPIASLLQRSPADGLARCGTLDASISGQEY